MGLAPLEGASCPRLGIMSTFVNSSVATFQTHRAVSRTGCSCGLLIDPSRSCFSKSISEFNVFAAVGHTSSANGETQKIFVVEQAGVKGYPPLYWWWCECCGALEEAHRNKTGYFELIGHPCADEGF